MKLIAFAIFFVLVSCATSKQKPDPWIGKSRQEVMMRFGVPELTATDGKDGEILVYSSRRGSEFGGVYRERTNKASFFIDKAGVVYHVLYESSPTPQDKVNVQVQPKDPGVVVPRN